MLSISVIDLDQEIVKLCRKEGREEVLYQILCILFKTTNRKI
jgi:hypothetical protein